MDSTTAPAEDSASQHQQVIPTFSVREIYKAGWLRRTAGADRRNTIGPFGKKYDRLWAQFCIHDDTQPFLEFYVDPKSSPAHVPVWAASLAQVAHVSPSIIIQGDTFEFVITSSVSNGGCLRLGTGTREQMNEWVDVLRNRLRDIGLLNPKDNVYSPLPEAPRPSLSATRDPNSPLPAPPGSSLPEVEAEVVVEQDPDLYADTEPLEHVTVITVNEEAFDDPFSSPGEPVSLPATFSTRVRINSAPSSSSLSPTEALDDEHSYETIFTTSSSHPAQRQLPEIPPSVLPSLPPPLPPPPGRSHPHRREGLRRTVSVGGPPDVHQGRPVVPILLPAAPSRRREGLVLLPRPPIFVPAPPSAIRHGSPLFRPVQANASALQPVLGSNHGGGAEAGFSLKERQVARLRMEMQHPAGVRIVLKKKDCVNTIALIDALGAVWVAGWRQKEKPLLYNVFHIGDQIIRVGHCNIGSSGDIHRILKMDGSTQIEFIVRRMPFGRVFHLRRETEGQPIGLVTEISGAEIREVIPGSLAAQQGVPPLAISPLSSSGAPCSWTLTEINGRPLNLCSKEGEARDRLNAVGKAVSFLIQPTDFVRLLRKQLKNVRSYKDYLLG